MGNPGTLTQDRNEPEHSRYHSRFFVQVGHKTLHAAMRNHHVFTISCHLRTHAMPVKSNLALRNFLKPLRNKKGEKNLEHPTKKQSFSIEKELLSWWVPHIFFVPS